MSKNNSSFLGFKSNLDVNCCFSQSDFAGELLMKMPENRAEFRQKIIKILTKEKNASKVTGFPK